LTRAQTRIAFLAALGAAALACVCLYAVTTPPPDLLVRFDGDILRISAPRLNFLSGKALEHLKDGASVAFAAQLTISTTPGQATGIAEARSVARFALSYDIWEEKFSVVRFGDRPESRRASQSHLTAQQTQNWCLDSLSIDRSALPVDRPFYVQLDLRAEDPRDQLGIVGDPGINITRLIEIFSRPAKSSQPRWFLQNGPLKLAELRKASRG
jgi:hypothetical protein